MVLFFSACFPFLQANAIEEDIGYPSYIKNPTKLAAKLKDVSYGIIWYYIIVKHTRTYF